MLKPSLTDLAIAHTPLSDTTNEDGPYTVTVNLTSSHAMQSVTLRYRVDGGLEQSVAMAPTATPGQYAGGIPGQNAAAQIEYHVDAADAKATRRSPRIGEHRHGKNPTPWREDRRARSEACAPSDRRPPTATPRSR